jgi:hypothetical protein
MHRKPQSENDQVDTIEMSADEKSNLGFGSATCEHGGMEGSQKVKRGRVETTNRYGCVTRGSRGWNDRTDIESTKHVVKRAIRGRDKVKRERKF